MLLVNVCGILMKLGTKHLFGRELGSDMSRDEYPSAREAHVQYDLN